MKKPSQKSSKPSKKMLKAWAVIEDGKVLVVDEAGGGCCDCCGACDHHDNGILSIYKSRQRARWDYRLPRKDKLFSDKATARLKRITITIHN